MEVWTLALVDMTAIKALIHSQALISIDRVGALCIMTV